MALGGAGLMLLFLLVFVGGGIFWVWSLIDAIKRPEAEWVAAGQNKLVMVLVIALLGFVGSFVYLFAARPALLRVAPA